MVDAITAYLPFVRIVQIAREVSIIHDRFGIFQHVLRISFYSEIEIMGIGYDDYMMYFGYVDIITIVYNHYNCGIHIRNSD